MNKKILLVGLVALMLPIITLAALAVTATIPDLSKNNNYCATHGGVYLFTAIQQVRNDDDSGVAGNYWAKDQYARTFYVYYMSGDNYCAAVSYSGTFRTVSGASPDNTGIVKADVDGFMNGGRIATFTAHISPDVFKLVSAGFANLGTVDYKCNGNGNCPGRYNWYDKFFKDVSNYNDQSWGWKYQVSLPKLMKCSSSLWYNTASGNSGDIVC